MKHLEGSPRGQRRGALLAMFPNEKNRQWPRGFSRQPLADF